ncbi:ATP-binding protein [Thermithiobacillus plumbiphilus]|uniref:histidine kinase n=1 Tax=Thermithiobacillus plumbiphilus TaxID=1729899 RepID=A0ABU9D6Y0_9PROT
MTLLPRTLLGRTAWVIAAILIVSQLVYAELFRLYYNDLRAQHTANLLLSSLSSIELALDNLPPTARQHYLQQLAAREGLRLAAEPPRPVARPSPFLSSVQDELRTRFSQAMRISRAAGQTVVWVRLDPTPATPWVGLPLRRAERPFPWPRIGWLFLVTLLSGLGAWWLVRRINQPLQSLALAAGRVGRGELPPRLDENGPRELQMVSRAFNRMAQDVAALERDRKLLLAGVSHDLRTPLARLRLAIEMQQADAELQRGMIEDVEEMDAILGQFLAFLREDIDESASLGDLNALVRDAVQRFQRQGAEISLDLGELSPLCFRPLAMQRLLGNLLANAQRHGGGKITVQTRQQHGAVELCVLDRGPGIPADRREDLMQPFTRLDAARSGSGAGLGLAIVGRIATAHQARFELRDRPGGGLEARLILPARNCRDKVSQTASDESRMSPAL